MYSYNTLRERGMKIAGEMGMKPLRDIWQIGGYNYVFGYLGDDQGRKEADAYTRAFFTKAHGEEVDYFHNGSNVAEYMIRVFRTRWFSPTKIYSKSELEGNVKAVRCAFKIPEGGEIVIYHDTGPIFTKKMDVDVDFSIKAIHTIVDTIVRAADVVEKDEWIAVTDMASDAAWGPSYVAIRDDYGEDALLIARNVANEVTMGASHALASGLQGMESYPTNPFEKLLDIYELGLWPVTFGEQSVIWHPPIKKWD